jgi:DNA end-binding protein Ku
MQAAPRPYWTGFLKLSLVMIAVRLYAATTERNKVHFHMIHEPSGERVHQQLYVPGIGPVEREDIVKGYEYEKDRYVTIDPDDIKHLRLETTDTIDIVEFIDDDGVDPIYLDAPYYLVPDGGVAEEAYRVLREALRESGKVALGRVVINGQERNIALRPFGTGLLGNALRYPAEIRQPEDFFGSIAADAIDANAIDGDQLAIMRQIITRRTRAFDPSEFVDRYQEALHALIDEKLEGRLPREEPETRPAEIINLMDALKRSLAAEEGRRAKGPAPARTGTASRGGRKAETAPRSQRNLLLPVSGGRGAARGKANETRRAEADKTPTPRRRRRA